MKNKARRILLNGIWTTPIINAVSLPAHAVGSCCTPQDLDVTINSIVCDAGSNPNIGTFIICNNESTQLFLDSVVSPASAFISSDQTNSFIDAGQCSQITVSIDSCAPGTTILIQAYLYNEFAVGTIEITFP